MLACIIFFKKKAAGLVIFWNFFPVCTGYQYQYQEIGCWVVYQKTLGNNCWLCIKVG
jgi:hypothetical protein